jgi:hypothetical protein
MAKGGGFCGLFRLERDRVNGGNLNAEIVAKANSPSGGIGARKVVVHNSRPWDFGGEWQE